MDKTRFSRIGTLPQIGRRRTATGVVSVVGVLVLAAAFGPSLGAAHPQQAGAPAPLYAPPPTLAGARSLAELSDAFAAVVEAVRPSVVYIEAEGTRTVAAPLPQNDFFESPFDQFFRNPNSPFQRPDPLRGNEGTQRRFQGQGSGFIISEDGYIVTNNHVVEDADRFTVKLLDHRVFDAELVGRDPNTDIAVLRIDGDGIPALALGDSDALDVGEWVLAIGNPLGEEFSFTVTEGIVSAKGRGLRGLQAQPYGIQDFIQTDAAINPGNSGGPLINSMGEVVGVNAAIASPTGYFTGYGFAVPINLTKRVTEQLIATGRVVRAILGVSITEATPEDAEYVGLDAVQGAVVQQFSDGESPAREAGLEPGDVIIELDGQPVQSVPQLQADIGFRRPGDEVEVTVARRGARRKTYKVRLAEAPLAEQLVRNQNRPAADDPGFISNLGVSVTEITKAQLDREGIDGSLYAGLEVTRVDPDGPGRDRLQPRTIITKLDGERVRTRADLRRALAPTSPGQVVSLTIARLLDDGGATTRIVRLRTSSVAR